MGSLSGRALTFRIPGFGPRSDFEFWISAKIKGMRLTLERPRLVATVQTSPAKPPRARLNATTSS